MLLAWGEISNISLLLPLLSQIKVCRKVANFIKMARLVVAINRKLIEFLKHLNFNKIKPLVMLMLNKLSLMLKRETIDGSFEMTNSEELALQLFLRLLLLYLPDRSCSYV
jgi:hypothetical protein